MIKSPFSFFCRNGEVLPMEEATVSINNIEYSYGFGVYETFRVVKGVPLFKKEHIERLFISASTIDLEHGFDEDNLSKWIEALLQKIDNETYNIKILLIGAKTPQDASLFVFPLNPLFVDKKLYKQGIETITVEFERPAPTAKTLNMLPSYLAQKKAMRANVFEALSVHPDGCVYEGTKSNFFVVKDGTIITPPSDQVLEGVTKLNVLKIAAQSGITVIEEPIKLDELSNYDGAFLTSSSMKILPISKINDLEFSKIPEVVKKLISKYKEFIETYTS
ncbi:hypothetical protein HN512_02970 [Candidatus Peregrinibacteria bacterium]|jgi:branched-chain amino acid aminotransferase|nr:hypothetical protein [Candidatus Peregrinibacteria bacterium]MBT3598774.1 hypothetical protein [Candidatus Peregrinibacteria bacterium]MBT4367558.1 hypothetical protein [Candidatus Peregrinibacteria bacterium]MBT4585842.1 hypothetical protein [Candidatus Peregrinibacteria bacterium]MBT6731216.1 hypothetical protein [Candidatus Peregrinibacteria bacterium]